MGSPSCAFSFLLFFSSLFCAWPYLFLVGFAISSLRLCRFFSEICARIRVPLFSEMCAQIRAPLFNEICPQKLIYFIDEISVVLLFSRLCITLQ